MTDAERYKASEHPLARIAAAHLVDTFERRPCSIQCPRCKGLLSAYHYKPTFGIGFFVCRHCAWFHARPCLFEILKRAEAPQHQPGQTAAISATLDRIAGRVLPHEHRPRPFYTKLSGGKRSAERA